MWRTHADPKIVGFLHRDPRRARGRPATRCYEIPMEQECRTLVADARRGKNMFALGMLCSIYSLDLKLARDQIALDLRQEGPERRRREHQAARSRPQVGRGQPRFQLQHSGGALDRAADRGQRQHRAGAGRARVGHGNLRDVPDHAGDLGLALSVRSVREGRRHRAPGRGRDRGLRVRRSAPPTPASARSPSPPAPAIRSSRRRSASRSWARFRWSWSTSSAAAPAPASRPRPSRAI